MDRQLALALYLALAIAAAVITGAGVLHGVPLFAVVIGIGLVASIYRRQVLGTGNMTRLTAIWLGVYAVALIVASLVLRGRPI